VAEPDGMSSALAGRAEPAEAGDGSSPHASAQPAGSKGAQTARRRLARLFGFEELGITLALVVLVLLISAFHSNFLSHNALLNTLQSASFVAIIAYGMVFLLAMGELDLSVGGTYALSTIITGTLMSNGGVDPWLAALVGIAAGAGLGALNGLLASLLRLPLIIITLGTLSAYQGLATVTSNAGPVEGLPTSSSFFSTLGGDWLGIPVSAWAALVLVIVLAFVFTRTRLGTMVRAVGSNRQAAAFSGIPCGRVRLYAATLSGALAAVSGILSLAYFQGADPTIGGTPLTLQVVAAAVIGGTAISGGTGTVPGALLGALVVAVINSGLLFFQIPSNWSDFVTGAVIIIAVGTDSLLRHRRARRFATGQ
jgi:ribose transport system permease protein